MDAIEPARLIHCERSWITAILNLPSVRLSAFLAEIGCSMRIVKGECSAMAVSENMSKVTAIVLPTSEYRGQIDSGLSSCK